MTQDSRPWEQVTDPSYFRQVMGNMVSLGFGPRQPEPAHVRFGITGIGYAPNYQIEGPDGAKHCFRGMGHAEASEVDDEFAPGNLSEDRFSYADIQAMLARLTA
jgi:hypothetical protein